jgi:hypothetical protein
MKAFAVLGAILAVSAAATAHAKSMPQGHDPGGPLKQGRYCWVYTSSSGAGWWDHCDNSGRAISLRGRENEVDAAGGGDGGGGGGGNGR